MGGLFHGTVIKSNRWFHILGQHDKVTLFPEPISLELSSLENWSLAQVSFSLLESFNIDLQPAEYYFSKLFCYPHNYLKNMFVELKVTWQLSLQRMFRFGAAEGENTHLSPVICTIPAQNRTWRLSVGGKPNHFFLTPQKSLCVVKDLGEQTVVTDKVSLPTGEGRASHRQCLTHSASDTRGSPGVSVLFQFSD